ncbi:MAG: tellurite resistance TerB family protein [Hyphomonadaceae bacterium]|nr:MAG: hypothetical protein FD160_3281 [Caulobacteraceae bacterium]MBT9446764.1 tellurite resistance TerB family protein [Hyphomonadaceae bacterium]TPW03543.1 MAG: hypothetical protein FD124_2965 [Alphaproteobacteria bacterium]
MIDADKILKALQTDPAAALRELGGQMASGAASAGGDVIDRLKTDPNARNIAIAGAGGALAGMLAGAGAPKFTGALAKLGGVAALGGLAWYAWKRHEARQQGATPLEAEAIDAPPPHFLPLSGSDAQRLAKITLKAMINAAKADGRIDAEEKARLFDRLGQVSLTEDERDFLFDELARPIDTDGLVRESTSPAVAAQIYAASLLAIDPDQPSERAYLAELARRLGVDPGLAAEIRTAA